MIDQLLTEQQQRTPRVAKIRADECIGCTKCIQACPVDAIIGAAKQLHMVFTNECIGCSLCVAPCPVDCIDMIDIEKSISAPDHARQRFNARQSRLEKIQREKSKPAIESDEIAAKQAYVAAAIARAKAKRK